MASSSTQNASMPITVESLWKYDAFLSFRGKETRNTFTTHLHEALQTKKIQVFWDYELERGRTISELFTSIAESRFAIAVLSQEYASSTWCLKELVKIFECMEERKTIIPIFYKVHPSDVEHIRGTFEEAFNKHEQDGIPAEDMQAWKEALKKVAGVAGWISGQNQDEAKFIKEIVDDLYKKLACDGCNKPVDNGLNCLGTVWHPACLVCKRCNRKFTELECWKCEGHPYHRRCYELLCVVCNVCKKPVEGNSEGVDYMEHPIWRKRYCCCHVTDRTPRCCSCERLHPRDTTCYKLNDGRTLCEECKGSIINTDDGLQSIFLEVREFFEKLHVTVKKIPVRMVGSQDIIDVMKEGSDGSDPPLPVIRAVCLYGEHTVTSDIMASPRQIFCEVEEILILYGLPRILTGSLLAEQMMRAWLRLNCSPNLSPEVKKGICRYFACKWLESCYNNLSGFEKKLCEFRKHKIESDGKSKFEALVRAKNAVSKHGLAMTLETIRKTGDFPSVTH